MTRLVYYIRRFLWVDADKEHESHHITSLFGNENTYLSSGMYEEFASVSCHICNRLFSLGEDGVGTRIIAYICKILGRYQNTEGSFNHSKIIHIP